MNDEFRKALDTRLSGLQWGEREQAQVLRAIRQKEEPEVKHIKRGTMILAFAMATLLVVMGAALATGSLNPSVDGDGSMLLDMPPAFEPVIEKPVLYESERLIVYEESAYYDGVNGELILRIAPADRSRFSVACQWNEVKLPGRTTLVVKPSAEARGLYNSGFVDRNYTFESTRAYAPSGYDLLCTVRLTENIAAEPKLCLYIDMEIDDESTGEETNEGFLCILENPFFQTYYHVSAQPLDTNQHPFFAAGSLIQTDRYQYATLMFTLTDDVVKRGWPSVSLIDSDDNVISEPTPLNPRGSAFHIDCELNMFSPDCLMVQESKQGDFYVATVQLPGDMPLPDKLIWQISHYGNDSGSRRYCTFTSDLLTDKPLTILKQERGTTLFLEKQRFDGENLTMTLLTSVRAGVELTDFRGYLPEQKWAFTHFVQDQLSDVSSRVVVKGSVTPDDDPSAPLEINLTLRYKDIYGNNYPLEVDLTVPVNQTTP